MLRPHRALVFGKYIACYDELDDEAHDEGYKWAAVAWFQSHWDINAADFPVMFKTAMQETSVLIDNATVQPVNGIQYLLGFEDEVEFVRQSFADLFSEDGGDLEARQARVVKFVAEINARIEIYIKSWKYLQNTGNVINYLNLWRPAENYFFKATEASDWTGWILYGGDIGSGTTFSLRNYYHMCDELLVEVRKNEQIMQLTEQRVQRKAPGLDDQQHILVYDIIYCAHAYSLYGKIPKVPGSGKQKEELANKLKEIKLLQDAIQNGEAQIKQLQDQLIDLPDLTGAEVQNLKYGTGTVVSCNDGVLVVNYADGMKKHSYPLVLANGTLTCNVDDHGAFKNNMEIEQRIKELMPHIDALQIKLETLMESVASIIAPDNNK